MKKIIVLLCALMLPTAFVSCSKNEDKPDLRKETAISLIPIPQQCEQKKGFFILTPETSLGLDDSNKELVNIASLFNEKISPATGFELPVNNKGDITFTLVNEPDMGNEGYQLKVSPSSISLSANKPAGLFYAMQTLLQLLPSEIKGKQQPSSFSWKIPCVEIKDAPSFAWRGLLLDVSRHWFTKEEVMKYIDQLAEYKFNVFHWHLNDDQGWRLEIKSLPRLAEIGGFRAPRVGQWWHREPQQPGEKPAYGGYYTHDDVREVLAYAAKRHVRVIPEIDVPGHSLATLVAYPELACSKAPETVSVGNKFYGKDENTLCVGKEETFKFMEQVLTEVAELFPDEYIHIGGDECFKGFWKKCPRCQQRKKDENLQNENELQSYFIRRMENILKEKGKKLIGWDEILEGGLAPDATVMSWRGMKGGIQAAKAGHKVIMTPNNHCYLDLWQGEPSVEPDTYSMCRLRDSYHFNPVPEGIDKNLILGGQGNLWTESVPTFRHAQYMTWPRGWALAEVLWSGTSFTGKTGWNKFIPRVEHHFTRADQAEINYARSMYNAIITPYQLEKNGAVKIELSSELDDVDIYYTFDNTDPDHFSPKYVEALSIPKNATWLRVITYRNGKPIGKVITLTTKELRKKSERDKRKS